MNVLQETSPYVQAEATGATDTFSQYDVITQVESKRMVLFMSVQVFKKSLSTGYTNASTTACYNQEKKYSHSITNCPSSPKT